MTDGPDADPVTRLRTALDAELTVLFKALLERQPDVDPVSFSSLLIDYGVELAVASGLVPSALMADYLRALAEAIDTESGVWPSLCLPSRNITTDPPF